MQQATGSPQAPGPDGSPDPGGRMGRPEPMTPPGTARPTGDDGQTMVEYSLILGLVVVAAVLLLPPLWWVAFGIYDSVVQAFADLSLTL